MENHLLVAYAFHRQPPPDPLLFQRLSGIYGPWGALSALIYLFGAPERKEGACVSGLLDEVLPRLMPQLTSTTIRHKVELYAGIRGRVDWAATTKGRLEAGGNDALFISQESRRLYDQAENQLLKFVLARTLACVERIPAPLGRWLVQVRGNDGAPGRLSPAQEELERMRGKLARALKAARMREIETPRSISDHQLAAARTAKNDLYHYTAEVYERYRAVVEAGDWPRWAHALRSAAPLPPEVDELSRELVVGG